MKSDWIKIASLEELNPYFQETPTLVLDIEQDGSTFSVLLIKADGEFHALENRCSHDNAEMEKAKVLDGRFLQCPRHGAKFDIHSGIAVTMPAKAPIKKYPLKEEDALLFIQLN